MHRVLIVEASYYQKIPWVEVATFNADLDAALHTAPFMHDGEVRFIKGADFIAWAQDPMSPTWEPGGMLSMITKTVIAFLQSILTFNIDVRLILLEYDDLPEQIWSSNGSRKRE